MTQAPCPNIDEPHKRRIYYRASYTELLPYLIPIHKGYMGIIQWIEKTP